MELWKQILHNISKKRSMDFELLQPNDINKLVESECYQALVNIKRIIENDDLEDKDCFMRIEEIVRVFEKMGSDGGNRHDFG